MYPTVGASVAPVAASLAAAPPPQSSTGGGGGGGGDGPLFPLLRVEVAPALRLAPPVREREEREGKEREGVGAAFPAPFRPPPLSHQVDSPADGASADAVPAVDFAFDFGAERAAVAASGEGTPAATTAASPTPSSLPDPWAPFLAAHGPVTGGLAAALARARGPGDAAAVAARAAALESLTSMGFPPATAAGGLEAGGGDLQAATDACLAAQ
jgi:hypothetical protein